MIEGNLLGTALNLFMVHSPTATRDVAVPARHTSTHFLLCIFSPPKCTNNTKWSEGLVSLSISPRPRVDLVISRWVSCLQLPTRVPEMRHKTMHNVRPRWCYCIYKSSPAQPLPFFLPEERHVCAWARCSWVTGSGINVIPCWWLESVDNRDFSKGDQSRLAQDTVGGLVVLPVINTGCYVGAHMLMSPHRGNTGSAISMEEKC